MITYKNPKVTEKNISFRNYILSTKSGFDLEIYFGAESPFFKCEKNLKKELLIEGGLIQKPICELPKFGFFKNFWTHKSNRCDMRISTDTDKNNLDVLNKHYKTSYKFQDLDRKKIFGLFKLIDEKNSPSSILNCNFISINHSYDDYIYYLYDHLSYRKKPFKLNILVQKISEWNSWPIVDMSLHSDYSEIIKNEFFDISSTIDEYPRKYNLLIK